MIDSSTWLGKLFALLASIQILGIRSNYYYSLLILLLIYK